MLLEKLYVGQQIALYEDVVSIPGFFSTVVAHIEDADPAQALMQEISGGRRDFPPELTSLFRRYRRRIPALPRLWRISVFQELVKEEELLPLPLDSERNDLEEEGCAPQQRLNQKLGGPKSSSLGTATGKRLRAALLRVLPLCVIVIGAERMGSDGTCEEPIGTLILVDGLLLLLAFLGRIALTFAPRLLRALMGDIRILYPVTVFFVVSHVGLVVGLTVAIDRVDSIGDSTSNRNGGRGAFSCSTGTFAWGVFVLVVDFFCLAALTVVACLRCWDGVVKSTLPALVLAAAYGETLQAKIIQRKQ